MQDPYVTRMNIEHFERLLQRPDLAPEARATVETLLDAERHRLDGDGEADAPASD